MEITNHSVKRFLQRVKGQKNFSKQEFELAKAYLANLLKNITPSNLQGYCPLPEEKNFVIAYSENTAVTILPKEYVKIERLYLDKKISKREYKKYTRLIS